MFRFLYSSHESGCLSPHYNCTSPMDYNSHHSLHYNAHIPIHHCTNHTAVTSHSLALIVLAHLHLIHSPTYKQHTSLHTLRSLVFAPADIPERLPFPSVYHSRAFTIPERLPFPSVYHSRAFTIPERLPFPSVYHSRAFTIPERLPFPLIATSVFDPGLPYLGTLNLCL